MQPRQLSVSAMAAAVALCVLLEPSSAAAIDADSGPLVPECAWSSVIQVTFGSKKCTGYYLGDRTFVSAAHCYDNGMPSKAVFGEEWESPVHEVVDFDDCYIRDDWNFATNEGTDIVVCQFSATAQVPSVPPVQPMVPTGCARDQLAYEIYVEHGCPNTTSKDCGDGPDVSTVGMGCEDISNESDDCGLSGRKRAFVGKLMEQTSHIVIGDGTLTKLRFNENENSSGSVPGTGVNSGDSGGPLLYRFNDGSWRTIGVLHGAASLTELYEALPPYLHWVEDIGGDLTPCHDLVDGEWQWQGSCANSFVTDVELGYDSWANVCTGASYGGGYNECGVTDLNLAPPKMTMPTPGGLMVNAQVLDDASPGILQLAEGGAFGRPADADAIAEAFVDVGWGESHHGFLEAEMPAGLVELYPEAARLAADIIQEIE